MADVEYEAEVKIRRNGRIIRWEKALGDDPEFALDSATNDLRRDLQAEFEERWARDEAQRARGSSR